MLERGVTARCKGGGVIVANAGKAVITATWCWGKDAATTVCGFAATRCREGNVDVANVGKEAVTTGGGRGHHSESALP